MERRGGYRIRERTCPGKCAIGKVFKGQTEGQNPTYIFRSKALIQAPFIEQ